MSDETESDGLEKRVFAQKGVGKLSAAARKCRDTCALWVPDEMPLIFCRQLSGRRRRLEDAARRHQTRDEERRAAPAAPGSSA